MKIKRSQSISFLWNMLLLASILAMLIFTGIYIKKQEKEKLSTLPKQVQHVDFITKKSTLFEVLNYFNNHTILLSVKDEAATKLPKKLREKLAKIGGLELSQLEFRNSYAGVFTNGKILLEKRSSTDPVSLKYEDLTIKSSGHTAGLLCLIKTPE